MDSSARTVRGSAGALLLSEKRALTRLRKETRAVLGDLALTLGGIASVRDATTARVWALSTVAAAAKEITRRTAAAVLDARKDARTTALTRFAVELGAAAPAPSDAAEDAGLADAAGASYGAAWSAAVTREVLAWADDPQGAPRIKAASDAQDYRLARIAATEVSRAYNDEHGEAARALKRPGLMRRWEAILDRRVCKKCKAMDGKTVPVDAPFPNNAEPGELHPVCRCFAVLVGDDVVVPAAPDRPAAKMTYGNSRPTFGPSSGYLGGGGTFGGGGSTDSF